MNILITGGAGFIGTNLIRKLCARSDADITVLDNLTWGAVKSSLLDMCTLIEGDILDAAVLDNAVRGMDAVVHLAADTRVMDSIENPQFNFKANVEGSFSVLEAMRRHGVKKFVCASTGGAIIGHATPPVHEQMLPKPVSPYGASKLCLEAYCHAYRQTFDIDCTALRFSNVYGPFSYHKGSVIAAFMRRIVEGKPLVIYGDGTQTRDFVYIDDLIDGILSALFGDTGDVIYQLGSGVPTSINEIISILTDVVGDDISIVTDYRDFRCGEIRHTYCDISKAKMGLGYAPKITINEGIEKTWQWFLQEH